MNAVLWLWSIHVGYPILWRQPVSTTLIIPSLSQILVTPLTRRSFNSTNVVTDSLANEAKATKQAAANTKAAVIDLNAVSKKYVQAIGKTEATKLDADYRDARDAATAKDNTHLNAHGSAIFGRMVADLIVGQIPDLVKWFKSDRALSAAIAAGNPY